MARVVYTETWGPLEQVVGMKRADDFMFMGTVLQDGTCIHRYKHIDTRRYLNLGDDLQPWAYGSDGIYHPVDDLDLAVRYAYS